MSHYIAVANVIVLVFSATDQRKTATIEGGTKPAAAATAIKAAELLNKARHLNDVKRRYTESARTIATVEALPGFVWTEEQTQLPLL